MIIAISLTGALAVMALVFAIIMSVRLAKSRAAEADARMQLRDAESVAAVKIAEAQSEVSAVKAAAEARVEQMNAAWQEQKAFYERQLADREKMYNERLEEMRSTLQSGFKSMAAETLDATVEKHQKTASHSLEMVLNPIRDAFRKMTEEFEKRQMANHAERTLLQDGINVLRQLNMQVSDETRRLTRALKGNTRFQGEWGEMVLENILEKSGLERSRWMVYQETSTTENGETIRPDAVIHCPRNRDIVIDSKVSLTAYLSMIEAQNDEEQKEFRKEHLHSIEQHLNTLSKKSYHENVGAGKAGFVLMFVPHEGAYLSAMQADPQLWQKAYNKHVVIVSPTHLVTVVRLVEQMWQTEDQTKNSIDIAEEATKMLDQLNEFLGDLMDSEKYVEKAAQSLTSARKRLVSGNGNVVKRAERLKQLGIKTKKALRLESD